MTWFGDLLVVLAATTYVVSAVPLGLLVIEVSRWLLFHRRPELGTRTPDGIITFVLGAGIAALMPCFLVGLIVGDQPWGWLASMLVVMALTHGFFWIMLRDSFAVARAELRYTLARRRALRARAAGRFDPAAEEAARQAERSYLSIRHWQQER